MARTKRPPTVWVKPGQSIASKSERVEPGNSVSNSVAGDSDQENTDAEEELPGVDDEDADVDEEDASGDEHDADADEDDNPHPTASSAAIIEQPRVNVLYQPRGETTAGYAVPRRSYDPDWVDADPDNPQIGYHAATTTTLPLTGRFTLKKKKAVAPTRALRSDNDGHGTGPPVRSTMDRGKPKSNTHRLNPSASDPEPTATPTTSNPRPAAAPSTGKRAASPSLATSRAKRAQPSTTLSLDDLPPTSAKNNMKYEDDEKLAIFEAFENPENGDDRDKIMGQFHAAGFERDNFANIKKAYKRWTRQEGLTLEGMREKVRANAAEEQGGQDDVNGDDGEDGEADGEVDESMVTGEADEPRPDTDVNGTTPTESSA